MREGGGGNVKQIEHFIINETLNELQKKLNEE